MTSERKNILLSSDMIEQALKEFFKNNPVLNPVPTGHQLVDPVLLEREGDFILYYDLEKED